jgi:hypothetical protein
VSFEKLVELTTNQVVLFSLDHQTMHAIRAREAVSKKRKKTATKKIIVPKAEIESTNQQQLLDNPLMVFSSMAQLMKDYFP